MTQANKGRKRLQKGNEKACKQRPLKYSMKMYLKTS